MNNRQALGLALIFAGAGGLFSQTALAIDEADFRFDSTEALYDVCSAPRDAAEYAVANQACRAFLQATVQYHDEISARRKLKRLICYPNGATIEDAKQAFLAWASENAKNGERMAEPPVVGVVRALAAKYPCRK